MIKVDGMLLIGSAGRNVGKTELACALIRNNSVSAPIVGVKVTTIRAKDGRCPRGGRGCGVCSSLDGDFCITEEMNRSSRKDTSRLLKAGASRVFWLRVMKTHLREGLAALLDVVGEAVLVCESNSLRQAVEPAAFIMVTAQKSGSWKSSARTVKKDVDKIMTWDGNSFDFDIDRIKLADGKWTITEEATAIIMAGGQSRRMGADKSLLLIDGRPMVEAIANQLRGSFSQILISANEVEKLSFLNLPIIRDRIPGQGPLMGIASALQASENELNFVVACDIPYIDLHYVRRMLMEADGVDVVVPTTDGKRYETLFAVYHRSILGIINEVLASGGRKISDIFSRCRVKFVELEAQRFVNLNTMADFEEYQKEHDVRV
jgi:molybdopterin-guanine dinucleotide biosynthesis protein A